MGREFHVRFREGLGVQFPRATRLVICCKPGRAAEAYQAMRDLLSRLRLTVNEKKTRTCSVWKETFTFLGFTFGVQTSWRTGRVYVTPCPSKKKVQAICQEISRVTERRTEWRDDDEQVARLNQKLVGWATYFRLGYVTAAWRVVQQHTCRRLRQWLRRKHRKSRDRTQSCPDMRLYEEYGLVNLVRAVRRCPLWA
jgi:RNA-directed DNA polymerase